MKAFTSLKQSKKLAKILPIESADMIYYGIHQGIDGNYHLSGMNTEDDIVSIFKDGYEKVFDITDYDIQSLLPCWSLAALLGVLPFIDFTTPQLIGTPKTLYVCKYNDDLRSHPYDNAVDACYEMILKLYELKML